MAKPKPAGGGLTVADTPGPPADIDAFVRQHYPNIAWTLDIPDLKAVLTQAAQEQWTPERLQGAVYNTPWWRAHDQAQRNWQQLVAEDPAQAIKLYSNAYQKVSNTAATLGIVLDPKDLAAIAHDVAQYQQGDVEVKAAVVNRGTPNAGGAGGYADAAQTVKARAGDYYVPLSDQAAGDWAKRLLTGTADQSTLDGYLQTMAKSRFNDNGYVTRAIDAGYTAKQIFDPYVQQTANLLGVAPDLVDLNNPKWSAMLDSMDAQGTRRPMSLAEAAAYVRSSPDYATSVNGRTQATQALETITRTFGRTA